MRRVREVLHDRAHEFGEAVQERGLEGKPWQRLTGVTFWLRVCFAVASVVLSPLVPNRVENGRPILAALGLVLVVYALLLRVGQTRWGPRMRILGVVGDTVFVYALFTLVPPARMVALLAWLVIAAFYATLGGLTLGLAATVGSVGFAVLGQSLEPRAPRFDTFTLTMFGLVSLFLVVLLHVTTREQRMANRRLARLHETERSTLERLRELDSLKADFIATVSHELRTPLTSIEGFSELLVRRWARWDDDEKLEMVERITLNSTELRLMIEQLLDFSRLEGHRIEAVPGARVDLREAVLSTVQRHGPAIDGSRVTVEVPPGLEVEIDAFGLERIFGNLLTNAAKYSPAGSPIHVAARWTGRRVTVSVRDHGTGIPRHEQERIFDRFYRSPSTNGNRGTGLGLAIARRYAELYGGRLWVVSEPGEGSTFSFTLNRP